MSLSKNKTKELTIATLPTAPATAVRLRFFQPSIRPVNMTSDWLCTPWGRCRITGRLGQRHADLIDACMHDAIDTCTIDGRLKLLIDPYTIRQKVGGGKQFSYSGTKRLFREIMSCLIEWNSKRGSSGYGHIIDSIHFADVKRRNPLTGDVRELWSVSFGSAWTKLIYDDIALRYDPADIINLRSGITQAVVRLLLSHNKKNMVNGIRISTIFDWLLVPHGTTWRNYMRNLRSDSDEIEAIGFKIDGDFIFPINAKNKTKRVADAR